MNSARVGSFALVGGLFGVVSWSDMLEVDFVIAICCFEIEMGYKVMQKADE